MEQSDIPVFIGIGNDNQPITTKITSINFARLLRETTWNGEWLNRCELHKWLCKRMTMHFLLAEISYCLILPVKTRLIVTIYTAYDEIADLLSEAEPTRLLNLRASAEMQQRLEFLIKLLLGQYFADQASDLADKVWEKKPLSEAKILS